VFFFFSHRGLEEVELRDQLHNDTPATLGR